MPALLSPSRWPVSLLLILMATSALTVAWLSFGLISVAMANIDFLMTYRMMALLDGGLTQAALLTLRGALLLAAFLCFKVAESELVDRWRRLGTPPPPPSDTPPSRPGT